MAHLLHILCLQNLAVILLTGGAMSFSFSMQKILDYRAMLEEEAKVRLSKAQQAYKKEEEHFVGLKNELSSQENEMCQNRTQDAASRWLLESYIKGLNADIHQSYIKLRQLHESVNQCKELVLIRAKDKKVLEKLKEKQQERYHAAEKELERKINDEAATLRFNMVSF